MDEYTILPEFLKNDFEVSILKRYSLHTTILDLAPDKILMHSMLEDVFKIVYLPFTNYIRNEMNRCKIVNEISLYLKEPICLAAKNRFNSH